jgi:hypothetical protein
MLLQSHKKLNSTKFLGWQIKRAKLESENNKWSNIRTILDAVQWVRQQQVAALCHFANIRPPAAEHPP